MTIDSLVAKINRIAGLAIRLSDVVRADADGGVDEKTCRAAVWISADCPSDTVISRHHDGRLATATSIWNIDRSIRRHFYVPVNARALCERIDRHAGAECDSAIIASRAERRCRLLRAIVNGVRITRMRRRCRYCVVVVWTTADCLMVYTRRNPAALARLIGLSVVVSDKRCAVLSC